MAGDYPPNLARRLLRAVLSTGALALLLIPAPTPSLPSKSAGEGSGFDPRF
jgi:hypothetical protein